MQDDAFTIRWTTYSSQRVDTMSLKKELPEWTNKKARIFCLSAFLAFTGRCRT